MQLAEPQAFHQRVAKPPSSRPTASVVNGPSFLQGEGAAPPCLTFRKVANWYCKVLRPGRAIQQQLMRIESVAEFAGIVTQLREMGGPGNGQEPVIPVPRGPIERW